MKNIQNKTIFILLMISLTNCVSTKYVGDKEQQDYNQRYLVTNLGEKKSLNAIGMAVGIGSAVGGAIAAENISLVKITDGTEIKSLSIANYAVGALVGWGVTELINRYVFKQGRFTPCNTPELRRKWIINKSKEDLLVEEAGSDIRMIKKSAENNFFIRNIYDFRNFKTAFYNSNENNINKVLKQSINILNREELFEVNKAFDTYSESKNLQLKILSLSKSLDNTMELFNMFPNIRTQIVNQSYEKIQGLSDALNFHNKIGFSKFNESQQNNLSNNLYSNINSLSTARDYLSIFYQGNYIIRNNKYNYVGSKGNGLPNGKGYAFYENKNAYAGEWLNGKRHGTGKLVYEFKNSEFYEKRSTDLFSGDYTLSCSFYEGAWVNDMREGMGTETLLDGKIYKGNYTNDKKNGSFSVIKSGINDSWYDARIDYKDDEWVNQSVYKDYYTWPSTGTEQGDRIARENSRIYQEQQKIKDDEMILKKKVCYHLKGSGSNKWGSTTIIKCVTDDSEHEVFYWKKGMGEGTIFDSDGFYHHKKSWSGESSGFGGNSFEDAAKRACGCK